MLLLFLLPALPEPVAQPVVPGEVLHQIVGIEVGGNLDERGPSDQVQQMRIGPGTLPIDGSVWDLLDGPVSGKACLDAHGKHLQLGLLLLRERQTKCQHKTRRSPATSAIAADLPCVPWVTNTGAFRESAKKAIGIGEPMLVVYASEAGP
jgi:hypothetical protein